MLPEAIEEAASGRWREPVAALLESKGTPRAIDLAATVRSGAVSVAALLAEHGSPLWLADVDRARERLAGLRAAWTAAWAGRRDRLLLQDQPHDGVPARVRRRRRRRGGRVRRRVRAGARRRRRRRARGSPSTGRPSRTRCSSAAAADGALVIADSAPELERLALAGVAARGLRVGLPGPEGTPSRFGIAAGRRRRRAAAAPAISASTLEVLHVHLVSTDFTARSATAATGTLAASVRVGWAKPPAVHAQAASMLAGLAAELGVDDDRPRRRHPRRALAGGRRPRRGRRGRAARRRLRRAAHARAGPRARRRRRRPRAARSSPSRRSPTAARCAVLDAGTEPAARRAVGVAAPGGARAARRATAPTLVAGPLCLNIDVVAPGRRSSASSRPATC